MWKIICQRTDSNLTNASIRKSAEKLIHVWKFIYERGSAWDHWKRRIWLIQLRIGWNWVSSHNKQNLTSEALNAIFTNREVLLIITNMCLCLCAQLCLTLLWPHGPHSWRFLCPWYFPGKNTVHGLSFPFPGDLPNPGIEREYPALQADFLLLSFQ